MPVDDNKPAPAINPEGARALRELLLVIADEFVNVVEAAQEQLKAKGLDGFSTIGLLYASAAIAKHTAFETIAKTRGDGAAKVADLDRWLRPLLGQITDQAVATALGNIIPAAKA